MRDADVIDLYDRVNIGTKVMVLPNDQRAVDVSEQKPVVVSEQKDVAIDGTRGAMTARISVQSPRANWSADPTSFGLY